MTKSIEGLATDILDAEAEWLREDDARERNIRAARAVADAVRTTLGPKGLDKMLVDSAGMIIVTNDGRVALNEMNVEDPMGDIVVAATTNQDNAVGDGTTTAAVLTAELLIQAENLVDQGLHPTTIIRGFDRSSQYAREVLEEVATPITPDDRDVLRRLAATTMTGRGAESNREQFADLVVDAVLAARTTGPDGEPYVDRDLVKTYVAEGHGAGRSRLVHGAVVDKDPEHVDMPSEIEDATILLVNMALRAEGPNEREVRLDIGADQATALREDEENQVRELIDRMADLGVDAVFTQETINDLAQHCLARAGILGIRRIGREDIEFLADALDATILNNLDDFSPSHLGRGSIERDTDDEVFLIEGTDGFGGATVLVRGETMYNADENDRSLNDAIKVVTGAVNEGRVIAGGGAGEIELARRVRDYANTVDDREQLAIEAFADALEVVPYTLAKNAGLDPIDSLIDLRTAHGTGDVTAGLDLSTGEVVDMLDAGVVETKRVKEIALTTAVQTTNIVLRVDDVITAGEPEEDVLPDTPDEGGPGSEEFGRDSSL